MRPSPGMMVWDFSSPSRPSSRTVETPSSASRLAVWAPRVHRHVPAAAMLGFVGTGSARGGASAARWGCVVLT